MEHIPNIDSYCFSEDWLNNRMLFIAGPRQVGKTTYALGQINKFQGKYFNWDDKKVFQAYMQDSDFFVKDLKQNSLVVFDEIHKRNKWKNILKGIFDVHRHNYKFLVTGSALLDTFRKSGDSLVGRYFLTHLLPLSVGDLVKNNFKEFIDANTLIKMVVDSQPSFSPQDLEALLNLSGFPEPFFKSSESFLKRWQIQHNELLIEEDLKDLTNITNLDKIEYLATLLEQRITTPISYNSLSEILEVHHNTVKDWLLQLEKVMLCYKVLPYSTKIQGANKKSPKAYFYDWSFTKDPGARFENFIASHLLKACTLWKDRFGQNFDLHYLRTYEKQEVDFVITLDKKPWLIIEAKTGKPDIEHALYRFKDQLKVPAIVLTKEANWNHNKNGVHIFSANRFLELLP